MRLSFLLAVFIMAACSSLNSISTVEPATFSLPKQPIGATQVAVETAFTGTEEVSKTSFLADEITLTSTPAVENSSSGSTSDDLAKILGDLSYSGLFPDRMITLSDGLAYYEENDPGRPYVQLIDHLIVTGDPNGDRMMDTVVPLVDYSTGSGDFIFLTVVLNVREEPTSLDAFLIGDRSPVKSMTIDDTQIIVEMIGPGPNDPACCPTWNMRKVFNLEAGKLVELSSEEISKASLDDLTGTRWHLINLNLDQEPVQTDSVITLQFDDSQINGSSGCNSYNSSVSGDEENPQTFVVGPITVTQKVCSESISNKEMTYLTRLTEVVSWRYDFGYLSLIYKLNEDSFEELIFAPQEP